MGTEAFTGTGVSTREVIAVLAGAGLEIEPRRNVTRTYLDTFDGRLHAAGLRMEFVEDRGGAIVVAGHGEVAVRGDAQNPPRFASDVPPGPLRARLAPLIDVRALLPRMAVSAGVTRAVKRDRRGQVVVEAALYEDLLPSLQPAPLPAWTLDMEERHGYAKPAEALRKRLRELGLVSLERDTLDVVFEAARISRTGFDSSPTVPLDPAAPALDGFVAVFGRLADEVAANWEGTAEDIDPEFLHDLRVAVRRTRSILSQARHVLQPDVRRRFRDEFKWLADATSTARDLDVYVLGWDGYIGAFAERGATLDPILTEIQRQRSVAHAELAAVMNTKRAQGLLPSWRSWLADPTTGGEPGRDAEAAIGAVVVDRVGRAQAAVIDRGRAIGSDSPGAQLHELRKDAKQLRYLLECFGGVLPAKPRKAFVQRLKALQDNLGEHQDAEVHVAQLHELAAGLAGRASAEMLISVGQLVGHLDDRRRASRDEFADRFATYDSKATRRALADLLDAVPR